MKCHRRLAVLLVQHIKNKILKGEPVARCCVIKPATRVIPQAQISKVNYGRLANFFTRIPSKGGQSFYSERFFQVVQIFFDSRERNTQLTGQLGYIQELARINCKQLKQRTEIICFIYLSK